MAHALASWQVAARRRRQLPMWLAGAVAAVALIATTFWSWSTRTASLTLQPTDWVLLTDFENTAGDPLLDSTLAHVLERELTVSPFINVVPRERVGDVLQLMRKAPDASLDMALAGEVAQRDGRLRVANLVDDDFSLSEQILRMQAVVIIAGLRICERRGLARLSRLQQADGVDFRTS